MPMKSPPHPGRSIKDACLAPLELNVSEGAKALGGALAIRFRASSMANPGFRRRWRFAWRRQTGPMPITGCGCRPRTIWLRQESARILFWCGGIRPAKCGHSCQMERLIASRSTDVKSARSGPRPFLPSTISESSGWTLRHDGLAGHDAGNIAQDPYEFDEWWHTLSESEQGKGDARVRLPMERGPNLGVPFSSQVKISRFPEMRELCRSPTDCSSAT